MGSRCKIEPIEGNNGTDVQLGADERFPEMQTPSNYNAHERHGFTKKHVVLMFGNLS